MAQTTRRWLNDGITVVVTGIWAMSFVADIFMRAYEPPAAVHAALLLVLGPLFGIRLGKTEDHRD